LLGHGTAHGLGLHSEPMLGCVGNGMPEGEVQFLRGPCCSPQHCHALGIPVLSWGLSCSYCVMGIFNLVLGVLVIYKLLHDAQDLGCRQRHLWGCGRGT